MKFVMAAIFGAVMATGGSNLADDISREKAEPLEVQSGIEVNAAAPASPCTPLIPQGLEP